MSKQTIYLEVPAGYEFTGEFRPVKKGELYLTDDVQRCFTHISSPRLILRKNESERRIGWINIYDRENGPDCVHGTKEEADLYTHCSRIACVRVTYEVPCKR